MYTRLEAQLDRKIQLHEVFTYLFLIAVMGAKAVGMSEGQRPFTLLLLVGICCIGMKLLTCEYRVYEWIINIALLMLGVFVYHRTGHLEAFFAILIVIGMKGISLNRMMKMALIIWGPCFVFSAIRALLGFYDGYVGVQQKLGMDSAVIRYSLGYTHPNVLHMTYLIIVMMILYVVRVEKKKMYLLSVLLFIGNIYISIYSVSYTGFIVVSFVIALNIYMQFRKKISVLEKVLMVAMVIFCIVGILSLPFIIPYKSAAYDVLNKLINQRFGMIHDLFTVNAPKLFGSNVPVNQLGVTLDSSFGYMLMYHGIIAMVLFATVYIAELIYLLTGVNTEEKDNSRAGVLVLMGIALSGMIEQYVANLSFKNIGYFFLGDYVYNVVSDRIDDAQINNKFLNLLVYPICIFKKKGKRYSIRSFDRVRGSMARYFGGTPWVKCLLPAVLLSVCVYILASNIYEEPKHLYHVLWSLEAAEVEDEGTIYQYIEGSDSVPELNESLIIGGDIYDGVYLEDITWANMSIEVFRVHISSIFWGFIAGFVIAAIIANHKKLNQVCIEDPIEGKENSEESGSYIPGMTTCSILGVNIAVTNMKRTLSFLDKYLDALRGKYICVSNVHTTETSFHDEAYMKIQNGAVFALPDGKPLSYVSRNRGYLQADRVAGPDLMTEIFKISAEKGYRHYFFGSTEETLKLLKEKLEIKYPGIEIVGMCAPDYYKTVQDIPTDVDEAQVSAINNAKPDFIWVGLGAPKQEQWMAMHEGRVSGVMLGVGAGFDFHAGTVKRAPAWMQALYLEWLYRLMQDPKRLFKRYFSTNVSFLIDTWNEAKVLKKNKVKGNLSETAQSKKKLLIYAHYYAPDVASTGQILTELAEGLLDRFDVTVIAVVPSYSGSIDDYYLTHKYYLQDVRGVHVYRVRVPEFTKANKLSRVWNIYGYYKAAKAMTRKLGNYDYIFTISQPPILGGRLGVYGKKKNPDSKLIYNIQDFNPEQTASTGYSKNRMILDTMMRIDNHSIEKTDLVITVGRDLVDTLVNRCEWRTAPKYALINNWIDEKKIYPLSKEDAGVKAFKEKYGLVDKYIFMYSGNLGLYYDLENLMTKVISQIGPDEKTPDGREIVFVFVGGGGLKDKLEKYAFEHNMSNVIFIPYQDKDELNYSLNAADVHICVNARGIKGVSCPSKFYGIAAAGKPVLASLEEGSEIRCIIEETNGGYISEPEDYEGMIQNINKIVESVSDVNSEVIKMGIRNREYLEKNLTKNKSITRYADEISKI